MANKNLIGIVMNLEEKILKLFSYRLFPSLYLMGNLSNEEQNDLEKNIFDLQESIYKLDHYLESEWIVDRQHIESCWNKIYSDLRKYGVTDKNLKLYTAHIQKYQEHELELRAGLYPTRFKLEFFYFYKSCDVKLLRRLLYESIRNIKQWASLTDWRYFDLVTEVNDDVEDVFEDMQTINANGFLIYYFRKGESETRRRFIHFLNYIKKQSELRFSENPSELQIEIYMNTLRNIELTLQLIDDQFKKLKSFSVNDSRLFKELEKNTRKIS